jgi:diacylglycerol kinase (ATP)
MEWKEVIASFGYAFNGIGLFFRKERNAKIHAVAAVGAIGTGFYYAISAAEWLWILLAITLVLATEMANTALERLCNKVSPEVNTEIKIIKDISAGFVLITAFFALAVAAIIFIPYLF